jgi:hypothetical protein
MEAEVGLAIAATAALMSPRAREMLRRGAVYGLAGLMSVGETLTNAARDVSREAQAASSSGNQSSASPGRGGTRPRSAP